MNIISLTETANRAITEYDPSKGWSSSAQPIQSLSVAEYVNLAEQALPELSRRMVDFCRKNNYSYNQIPVGEYQEYERGSLPFRMWYESYCYLNNINPQADVVIIGPNVKPATSISAKASLTPEDRIRDYLRGMFIVLNNKSNKASPRNAEKMGDYIASIESDEATVGRKNSFWKPEQHGYRGHKALWIVTVPDFNPQGERNTLAGLPLLTEIKGESEFQQDMNRITRRIMHAHRHATEALPEFYDRCGQLEADNKGKNNFSRTHQKFSVLGKFGRLCYDDMHKSNGFDILMNPALCEKHIPAQVDEIVRAGKDVVKNFGVGLVSDVLRSGVELPRKLKAIIEPSPQ